VHGVGRSRGSWYIALNARFACLSVGETQQIAAGTSTPPTSEISLIYIYIYIYLYSSKNDSNQIDLSLAPVVALQITYCFIFASDRFMGVADETTDGLHDIAYGISVERGPLRPRNTRAVKLPPLQHQPVALRSVVIEVILFSSIWCVLTNYSVIFAARRYV